MYCLFIIFVVRALVVLCLFLCCVGVLFWVCSFACVIIVCKMLVCPSVFKMFDVLVHYYYDYVLMRDTLS